MNKTIDWAVERLSENSTWRGIILLVTSIGVTLTPDQSEKIIAAGLALIGLINVFRKSPPSAAAVAIAVNTGSTDHLVKPVTETKP
jgi:hypothetical protein